MMVEDSVMRTEARALGQALLDHHRAITTQHPPGKRLITAKYTIRYGVLCDRARLPHLVRIVGAFLGDVAEWCAAGNLPPLNALAVGENGVPGDGYDGAGGFKGSDWVRDVEKCIRFAGYPTTMP
jgi:hypothetical protein